MCHEFESKTISISHRSTSIQNRQKFIEIHWRKIQTHTNTSRWDWWQLHQSHNTLCDYFFTTSQYKFTLMKQTVQFILQNIGIFTLKQSNSIIISNLQKILTGEADFCTCVNKTPSFDCVNVVNVSCNLAWPIYNFLSVLAIQQNK